MIGLLATTVVAVVVVPALMLGSVLVDEWRQESALAREAPWTRENIERAEAQALSIAGALERYREEHGVYPAKLDALTPLYLSSIDPPAAGAQWWEYTADEDSYALCFGTQAYSAGWLYPLHALSPNYGENGEPGWYQDY